MIIDIEINSSIGNKSLRLAEEDARQLMNEFEEKNIPRFDQRFSRIAKRSMPSRNDSLFDSDWRERAGDGKLSAESAANVPRASQTATKGFLICECKACHKRKAFCTKYPLEYYRCGACGHRTKLEGSKMRPVYAECYYGRTYRYSTNCQDEDMVVTCMECGGEIYMRENEAKTCYITSGKANRGRYGF